MFLISFHGEIKLWFPKSISREKAHWAAVWWHIYIHERPANPDSHHFNSAPNSNHRLKPHGSLAAFEAVRVVVVPSDGDGDDGIFNIISMTPLIISFYSTHSNSTDVHEWFDRTVDGVPRCTEYAVRTCEQHESLETLHLSVKKTTRQVVKWPRQQQQCITNKTKTNETHSHGLQLYLFLFFRRNWSGGGVLGLCLCVSWAHVTPHHILSEGKKKWERTKK